MSTTLAHNGVGAVPPTPQAPSPSDGDLDNELAALPAPPQTRVRVLGALLTAISAASIGLAVQLRDDVSFALSSSTPIAMGDARTAAFSEAFANRMVSIEVTPQLAGGVRYSRLVGSEYLVFPAAGRSGEAVYVQVASDAVHAGQITGRLIPFSGAGGRYSRVGSFLRSEMQGSVSGSTFLLIADATPAQYLWAPVVASILIALALTDAGLMIRLFRKK